jgi:HK97 family phage major capsid protein
MDPSALTRYQGQVHMPLAVYAAALALGLPVTPEQHLQPIGYRKNGTPIYPIGGADPAAPVEITPEQLAANPAVQALLQASAEAAVRAVNTVDPTDRPAAGGAPATRDYSQAPAYLRARYAMPRVGLAMRAGARGSVRSSEIFEWDFAQAAREVFEYDKVASVDEENDPIVQELGAGVRSYRSIVWPKTREEFAEVLGQMGEKKHAEKINSAVRAMGEGTVGLGGALVPTVYAQDKFAYALVSTTVIRQIPGIQTLNVPGFTVILPRESVPAGAASAAEAGALATQDPTFAQQTITIKKQYGYRVYSNELLADGNPDVNEFIANSLVRDVGLRQDIQYLEGDGAGTNITGFVAYAGTTAGPSLGANGLTPSFDHLFDFLYNLRLANVEPDFLAAHPRYLNSLSKIKDTTNNYLLSNAAGYNAPSIMSTGLAAAVSAPKAVLLGSYPAWFSSQINIARTVGASGDCTNVYFGNRNNIVIVEAKGIEVAFSEHVAFANDQTAARAIGRSAIAVLQPAALGVMVGVRP